MLKTALFAVALLIGSATFEEFTHDHSECATCVGADNCRACKNCKYCGYCKGGKTCGVCRPRELKADVNQGDTKVLVVTKGEIGFKDGESTYALGMDSREFVKRFGEADFGNVDGGSLRYYKRGLLVQIKDHRVLGFVFYCVAMPGDYVPSKAVTDRGAKAGDHFDDVVKAHGKPTKVEAGEAFKEVVYPWGWFRFDRQGELNAIIVRTDRK